MIVKQLVQHGNSRAIVIEKSMLQVAGLEENALFQIIASPSGIIIESIKPSNDELIKKSFDKVFKENQDLLKGLSDR